MLKKNISYAVMKITLIEDSSLLIFTRDYCLTLMMSNEKSKVDVFVHSLVSNDSFYSLLFYSRMLSLLHYQIRE